MSMCKEQCAVKLNRVHVIINPASGQDKPMLNVLNTVFRDAGIDWDVFITKDAGDAERLAREAASAGVDAVVVYGGDGTVTEAAAGLAGTDVPLAILPGGTANAIALALGIPTGLEEAAALLAGGENSLRQVDMGQTRDQHFLIAVGIGIPGELAEGADREAKDRLGFLAYAFSSIQAVRTVETVQYTITVDGEQHQTQGVTCLIANGGNFGIPGLNLEQMIDMGDGLLDVLVIHRADIQAIVSLAASVVRQDESVAPLEHWRGREIEVVAEPQQAIQADGEVLKSGPITAHLLPSAVRFLVPASAVAAA
jgi:diacylglycerol kinase (ATP)